jgi:hypothetical protein
VSYRLMNGYLVKVGVRALPSVDFIFLKAL